MKAQLSSPSIMARPRHPAAIELRHLRYFLTVFEELHFGRAAARLYIAQPPLSTAIRKLEEELGVPLFERTSRRVVPTDAGRAFADEARKTLAAFELAVSESRRTAPTGCPLRIGFLPDLPVERLLQFLGALNEQDASAETQVMHLSPPEQLRRLRNGELDVATFHGAQDDPELELELEPLFPGQPLAAYLPPDHRLAAKSVVQPGDLRDEHLIRYPPASTPGMHDRLLALLEASGYLPRSVHEPTSTDVRDVLLPIARGLGVGFLPVSLRDASDAGRIVICRRLDPPLSMPDTVLAWRRNTPPRLRAILEITREIARELRSDRRRPR